MQKIRLYSSALILLMIFALSGCPEENDSLVNPPSQAETVNIRFVNLAGDNQSRSLRMTEYETPEVSYGQATETFHPPDDSTKATVLKNGRDEYSPAKQIKFFRKLTYTFFALPTAPGDSLHPLAVDTLIGINTSLTIPLVTNDGYVRLVNAYSDTNSNFSLVLGCAGGVTLAPSVRYRGFSSAEPVLSGENTFSVIYNNNGKSESLGLFRVDMVPKGEYSFVVVKDQSGNPKVYSLDEKSPSANAFGPAQEVAAKTTNIRTINFSNKTFDVNLDADLIVSSPTKNYIGKYNEYTACSGTTISSITTVSGGDTLSNMFNSLEVLRDYSLYLFDEGTKIRQILAPPFKVFGEAAGKSIIRVINGNPDYNGITVAFGARKVASDNDLRYGETIARDIKFGNTSAIGLFESGLSPITVFAATQPAKYITGVNFDLKKDKSYTMVLYKKEDGTPGFTIIEDEEVDRPVSEVEPGVFVQVVNGVAGPAAVRIGIEPLISESANELYYGLNLATVIPIGTTEISVNGKKKTIEVEKGKRLLVVASGTTGDEKILSYQSEPVVKYDNMYKIRFLNASTEIDRITISRFNLVDCPACPILANNIAYDELSFLQEVNSEAKISLFVYDPNDFAKIYHRVDDLKLNYNKAYSVIFTGNSSLGNNTDSDNTNNGYSVVIIQEY